MQLAALGDQVRSHRTRLRLTQKQLADLCGAGFSQIYISQIENGFRVRTPEQIQRLADALGITVDALTRPLEAA